MFTSFFIVAKLVYEVYEASYLEATECEKRTGTELRIFLD